MSRPSADAVPSTVARWLLVVAVVAGSLAAPAVAAPQLQPEDIDPDGVLLAVSVEESGDATWRITYRVRLDTDADEAAFRSFRSEVESDPATYRERFHNRMNATTADASAATGREMTIRNVSVTAEREELPQAYGVVTYRFRWTNFAATEGATLVVGDAIDGLLLDNETVLLVEWPDGYELASASPSPTETRTDSVLWEGPRRFASGEPRGRLAPDSASDATSGGELPAGAPLLAVAVALLLAGVALGVAARREVGPFGGAPSPDGPEPADEELLSNEEQVVRLLERNGGRMKQSDVAEVLGWTDAKTSQVTTTLREEGALDAFRLGRENVLELPDESE